MKMRYTIILAIAALGLLSFTSTQEAPSSKIKCMIQLINYTGEGAYCTVSLLDAEGGYVQTLQVLGEDTDWYPDIQEWYKFHKSGTANDIDGITGASIAGGKRAVFNINIDSDKVDAGYKIRFESAVEDQYYHKDDLVVDLNSDNLKGKFEGVGYIRYVRLLAGQ